MFWKVIFQQNFSILLKIRVTVFSAEQLCHSFCAQSAFCTNYDFFMVSFSHEKIKDSNVDGSIVYQMKFSTSKVNLYQKLHNEIYHIHQPI